MARVTAPVWLTTVALARLAHADGAPFVSGGATVGLALHDAGTGAVVGGELSGGWLLLDDDQIAHWHGTATAMRMPWFGGYVDTVYDAKLSQARFSFGPEIGYGPVGFDGGLVAQGPHSGIAARVVLTTAFVTLYARYDHIFDTAGESGFVELGVLLKVPHVFWPARKTD
jgi:hypothetical protein